MPVSAKLEIIIIDVKKGKDFPRNPYDRRSWVWWWKWIKTPAVINNKALKSAWVIRWKNVIWGTPIARLNIIVPSWLSVERAIIFFISHSAKALRPAINVVRQAENKRRNSRDWVFCKALKNRTRIKTPAVTRVEECTRAETGVGAAMAAGSQLIKGYCALLVIAAIISIKATSLCEGDDQGNKGSQCVLMDQEMTNRIRASPSRLVMAVIIAAPWDLGVW